MNQLQGELFMPSKQRFGAALLACLLFWPGAGPALAQQPSQAQANAIRQSCRSDYQSYCASVPTGGQASLQCLQQNAASLSPACQSAVAAVSGGAAAQPPGTTGTTAQHAPAAGAPPMTTRQKAAMMRQACGRDFRAYCRGVPLGGGQAIACLSENQAHLSRGCSQVLAQARAAR
jgi:hypothetical protein